MRKVLILFLSLFLGQSAICQEQNFSSFLATQFNSYREKYAQEKIYVTTDRQFYLTGELIWFKVYCVDATFHKPSLLSKVAYVEILNRENVPVQQAKIELEKGVGRGSFFLPTSISSDNYVLRSYTNWMKNLSPDLYFHKLVSIVNPFVRLDLPTESISDIKYEFFPEGGSLINSVRTKVAYKISSPGNSTEIRGFLLDEKNDTIKHLNVNKNGIGICELTANQNSKYRVLIKTKGVNSVHDFLKILPSGYSMKLTERGESIEIQILKTSEGEMKDENLILFVHTRNILVHNETKRLVGNQVAFSIPTREFLQGVSQITIFNEQRNAVCQRLYYKEPESLSSTIIVAKQDVGKRSANSLRFSTSAQVQNLSVSISKVDSLPSFSQPSIVRYLSLISDIGYEPLDELDNLNQQEIDDLLLTRNWKRFRWEDVLKNAALISYLPESRGLLVQAKVTDGKSQPEKDVNVYLSSPGKVFTFHNSKSDEEGNVFFELNNFYSSQRLIAQTNRVIDSLSSIEIQIPFSNQFSKFSIPILKLNEADAKRLLERSVRMQAQNIFFENFENQFNKQEVDSLPFYGKADEKYNLDDYTRFPVMEEVMREYVPGVIVRKRKDGFNFIVLDKKHNLLFKDNPLILLDGVPIFDANEIIQFDPLKVKRLEVVTGKYFHGNLEMAGIVSYFTYRGDLANFPIRSKNGLVDFEGLQNKRKFYSPSYSNNSESRLPDPRYLLLWAPQLESKELEFFTSDVPGIYLVKTEGITSSGQVVQASTTFQVVAH